MKMRNWFTNLFRSASPSKEVINISVYRILICFILAYVTSSGAVGYDKLYLTSEIFAPVPSFEWISIGQFDLETVRILRSLLVVSLLMGLFGIYTRPMLFMAAICYVLYYGNQLGFTKSPLSAYVYHSKSIAFFILLSLSISPYVDKISVDELKRNKWSGFNLSVLPSKISGLAVIRLLMGIALFGSAHSKLSYDLFWADGYTLQAYLFRKYTLYDNPVAWAMMHRIELCQILSIVILIFEIVFILCVPFKKLRLYLIPAAVLFHYGIYVAMNINFDWYFFIVYLAFIDYSAIPFFKKLVPSKAQIDYAINKTKDYSINLIFTIIVILHIVVIPNKLEAWPFAFYGVYIRSQEIELMKEYRFACYDPQQNFWVEHANLPRSKTTLNRLIRYTVGSKKVYDEYSNVYDNVSNYIINEQELCDSIILYKIRAKIQGDSIKIYNTPMPALLQQYNESAVIPSEKVISLPNKKDNWRHVLANLIDYFFANEKIIKRNRTDYAGEKSLK